MTNEFENLDKLFRKVTEGAEKSPPPYVWDKINSGLNHLHNRRKIRMLWLSAASFALLAAFGTGYFIALNRVKQPAVAVRQEAATLQPSVAPEKFQEEVLKTTPSAPGIVLKTVKPEKKAGLFQEKNTTVNTTGNQTPVVTSQQFTEQKEYLQNQPVKVFENQNIIAENLSLVHDSINEKTEIKNADKLFEPEKKNRSGRIRITAYGTPVLAYRNISNSGSNLYTLYNTVDYSLAENSAKDDRSYYNTIESPLIAFSGGMNVEFRLSNRISLTSGLHYGQYGQKNQEIFIYDDEMNAVNSIINSSAGDIQLNTTAASLQNDLREPSYLVEKDHYGTSIYMSPSQLSTRFSFLEIPVSVRYFLSGKSDMFYGNIGIAPAVLTSNVAILEGTHDKSIGSTQQIKPLNFTGFAGFGFNYSVLEEKLKFNIEPQFRYMLSPVSSVGYIRHHPYTFGLQTGLTYSF